MFVTLTSGTKLLLATSLMVCLSTWGQAQTRPLYVEGEVLVTFKETTTQRTAESSLQKRALRFEKRFPKISSLRRKPMGLVRNRKKTTNELIQELKSDSNVETVEPNYLRYTSALPNDARFNELWALRNTAQSVNGDPGISGADIRYEAAWAKVREVTGDVVVGVIDTGVEYTHPDLQSRMWTNTQEIANNGIDDDGNGYVDDYHGFDFQNGDSNVLDSGNHGTHVAGTIAAQGNNNQGIIGVNDRAKIMALKVSDDGDTISTSAVVDAIEYAINMKQQGVQIVALNASYGGESFSTAERNAIASAGSQGIILCAAAGNESANNNTTPSYPASYNLANIITVAATDQADDLADFSNYGSTSVDIAAPGSNILSTVPKTIIKIGDNSYEADRMTYSGRVSELGGQIIDCGIGDIGDFPPSVNGNIALIERGDLFFYEKAANAQAAGAVAVIIYNNASGTFSGTLQSSSDWIPTLSISRADGLTILASLPTNCTLSAGAGYLFEDGTSMAAPHVSGAVAFAAMNFPTETLSERVQRIFNSVDVKPELQGKVITGGRLNLNRVVDANLDDVPDWLATALIFTNPSKLKGGVVGELYSESLSIEQGTAPLIFTIIEGELPGGLTLASNGELTGTPTEAISATFTVMVTDNNNSSGGKIFTLVIAAVAPQIITTSPLPQVTTNAPYSEALSASGGTAPYSWSVVSGNLPEGLILSNNGVLSGFPTGLETSEFRIKVEDANELTHEADFSLTVIPSPITINTDSTLFYGIRGENYNLELQAEGGAEPYLWSRINSSLPSGMQLSQAGILSGKPTTTGDYEFRIQVRDDEDAVTTKLFNLTVRSVYSPPQIISLNLDSTYIGAKYSTIMTVLDYPKSFKIRGLPKGLTYSSKTGEISGTPKEAGEFTVYATAKNPAGFSEEVSEALIVRPLASEWIGNFTGIIARDFIVNQNLGSRFILTTTSMGSYSIKVTTGASSKSARGFLSESDPQIQVLIHGRTLSLKLDANSQLITGTHGTAVANGWRNPWNAKTNAANQFTGYYSGALNLGEITDQENEELPQGSGFITVLCNTAGITSITGRTATGDKITSSSGMGPNGEAALHQSLYKHRGSLSGSFNVDSGNDSMPGNNSLSGSLSWLKHEDSSRTYGAGFGQLPLSVTGGYLAVKSSGSIVQRLPTAGLATLKFNDGGLSLSNTDAEIVGFSYDDAFAVELPDGGSPANHGFTTLKINKATGAVSGTFRLEEESPILKRKVRFLGMIVPQDSNEVKAQGYFLLPQIPTNGQKSGQTPILSGGVQILQSSQPD